MGNEATVTIDNHVIHAAEGISILSAADSAGIYIPRLCYHPDLPGGPGTKADCRVYRHGEISGDKDIESSSYHGCDICIVEIEGRGTVQSCATLVTDGMVIHTDSAVVKELRKTNLARLISIHPHACILCSENAGCDRSACPQGEVQQGRCCPKFDNCEFQKVCEYVTIKDDVSQYIFKEVPVVDTPLFTMDSNLCIGCTRCIRACEKLQGKRVIGFTYHEGEFVLGTIGPSHKESGCVYCGACVTVCPTGAIMDKGLPWKKKERLNFAPIIFPPEENLEFVEATIQKVPEVSGVYELLDEKLEIIFIRGADNIRTDLLEKLQSVGNARFFRFEEHGMYTMAENELLQKFLKKYGRLPEVNNEISDLY
jgi:formate dehydrogenase (NADP+) beta subunit